MSAENTVETSAQPIVTVEFFSDPMMGPAWQCEDTLQKLKDRYGSAIEIINQPVMMVDSIYRFMSADDWKDGEDHLFERYNQRFARIYNQETAMGP